jgi:hypothetical protein
MQPAVAGDEQRAVPLGKAHDEVVRPIVVGRQRMPQRWVDRRCADTSDLGEEDGQIFAARQLLRQICLAGGGLDLEEQLARDDNGEPSQRGQSQESVGDATGCHGSADDDVGVQDRAHCLPIARRRL